MKKTTFDYLVMGFPVSKKVGVSMGLLPQSAVGYRLKSDTRSVNDLTKQYQGKGGVNKVFLGAGYKISPKLSVGMDLQYLFGIIDTQSDVLNQNIIYGSREVNQSNLSGVAVNAGLNFKTKFNIPFIYAVRGKTKKDILNEFISRLKSDNIDVNTIGGGSVIVKLSDI